MTLYYVRTTGNNASVGTSPATAWATLSKALGASGIASGDIVYVGAGTYRETVSVAMTSPGAETRIIGDVNGAQTGDAGDVILTAYTTNDTTVPTASATLDTNSRSNLTFENITIFGGDTNNGCLYNSYSGGAAIVLRRCTLIAAPGRTTVQIGGLTSSHTGRTFDQCVFFMCGSTGFYIELARNGSADFDVNMVFQNCLFTGAASTVLQLVGSGAGAFFGGGLKLYNNTFIVDGIALRCSDANLSTTSPCLAYNNLFVTGSAVALVATTSGQIVEDYNRIAANTPRTNVTAGANSIADASHALMLELGQAWMYGRLPRPYGSPMAGSPLLGRGTSGSVSLSVDFANRPRPAGGASTSKAWGALERHDTGAKETTTVRTGSTALVLAGPADHDFAIPVAAVSTTVTVYARYDTSHAATNKPQALILNGAECGVADATATMTAAVDTWEQLSFTFTPTSAGVVTLRLVSRSAGATGKAFFDDVAVS